LILVSSSQALVTPPSPAPGWTARESAGQAGGEEFDEQLADAIRFVVMDPGSPG